MTFDRAGELPVKFAVAAWRPRSECQNGSGLACGKHFSHCLDDTEAHLEGPALGRVAHGPVPDAGLGAAEDGRGAQGALPHQLLEVSHDRLDDGLLGVQGASDEVDRGRT